VNDWQEATTEQQYQELLESVSRLGLRLLQICALLFVIALFIAAGADLVETGQATWREVWFATAVAVGMILAVRLMLRRPAKALTSWIRRRVHTKVRKPLRATLMGRVALWFIGRALGGVAVEGFLAIWCLAFALWSGAYQRARTLLPAGSDWGDVIVVGAAAWFGARALDSAWTVLQAAIVAGWRKGLDERPRAVRPPPLDADL
jgi:hypothetical protein